MSKKTHYLDDIRELLRGFDEELDTIQIQMAVITATMAEKNELENLKGQLTEVQRHNGRTIKILASIITALIGFVGTLLYIVLGLV